MPFLSDLILGSKDPGGLRSGGRGLDGRSGDSRGLQLENSLTAGEDFTMPHAVARLERSYDRGLAGCGNVACRGGWIPPWKSRRHPIFERMWACGERCLTALVHSALAREGGEADVEQEAESYRHRVPLGLVLLAHGWITHPQLQKALEAQRVNGWGRIGDWLMSECGVGAEQVVRGLSAQWNCAVLTADGFSPQAMSLALPQRFIEEYGAVPMRVAGGKVLYVGFEDRLDASSCFAIERMSGLKTESGVVGAALFREAREALLRCASPEQIVATFTDREMLVHSIVEVLGQERPAGAKLVRLHRYYWLRVWNAGARPAKEGALPLAADEVRDYLFTPPQRTRQRETVPMQWADDDDAERPEPGRAHSDLNSYGALRGTVEIEAEVETEMDVGEDKDEDEERGDRNRATGMNSLALRENQSGSVAGSAVSDLRWAESMRKGETVPRRPIVFGDEPYHHEPLDGEYLQVETLLPVEMTDASEEISSWSQLRSGWSQSGFWSKSGRTSREKPSRPASGRGQAG